jgi:hypothetical protein
MCYAYEAGRLNFEQTKAQGGTYMHPGYLDGVRVQGFAELKTPLGKLSTPSSSGSEGRTLKNWLANP